MFFLLSDGLQVVQFNMFVLVLSFTGSTTPGSAGSKDSDRIRLESITSDRSENSGRWFSLFCIYT